MTDMVDVSKEQTGTDNTTADTAPPGDAIPERGHQAASAVHPAPSAGEGGVTQSDQPAPVVAARRSEAADEEQVRVRRELLDEVKNRCVAAKMDYQDRAMYDGSIAGMVRFHAGRDFRPLTFWRIEDLRSLLAQPFEKFVFLGNYAAICSYELGVIEATVRFLTPGNSRRLFPPRTESDEETDTEGPLELKQGPDGATLTLGSASVLLSLMDRARPGPRDRKMTSIKLQGVNVRTHDQALDTLEKIANSFFFQADLTRGALPSLATHRPPVRPGSARLRAEPPPELEFPRTEFDRAPLSLYFYARGAYGMPLLQFLAYYQVIEFYFPVYSQAEAQRRIRDIIKSPAFRPDRDADVGRILGVIRGAGPGLGDERSQLRATLNECVDPKALQEFLCQDERKEFFSAKKNAVARHSLPLKNSGVEHADLRNDVAERIYEIRCKIVHTKRGAGDIEVELLLPFSPEAEALHYDIELVQFVAREVLVAASSPLNGANVAATPDGPG